MNLDSESESVSASVRFWFWLVSLLFFLAAYTLPLRERFDVLLCQLEVLELLSTGMHLLCTTGLGSCNTEHGSSRRQPGVLHSTAYSRTDWIFAFVSLQLLIMQTEIMNS